MSKVAWIIGASAGIGAALSKKLATEGWSVAVSARSKDKLDALVKSLASPASHLSLPCDVLDKGALKKAYEILLKKYKHLDLMVFAAGIYEPMGLKDFDLEISKKTLDINLTGAFTVFDVLKSDAVDPHKPLHLAWMASVAGFRALPNSCAYGVSKAGLIGFAEIQRTELEMYNTKVQVINPGFVKTRLTDKNNFEMPGIITPELAADYIFKGLNKSKFDITFPPLYAFIFKLLKMLPDFLYFKISKNFMKDT